jgi:hypothetical protein
MTLTEEQFKQAYMEKSHCSQNSYSIAEHIHAYAIKCPEYFPNDSRLEPAGKKVFIKPSCQITGGKYIVQAVFELEQAVIVDSLGDADIAVYVGNYLCDWEQRMNMGEVGSSAVMPILYAVRDRNIPAVVIMNGRNYFEFCSGKCPEDKFMMDLINQGKNIHTIPLGWPYNRVGCIS